MLKELARRRLVTLAVAGLIALTACKSKKSSDEDDDRAQSAAPKSADRSKPKPIADPACRRPADPSKSHLGLKPKSFFRCLEKMMAKAKGFPAEAKKPFKRKGDSDEYYIADFMAVSLKLDGDYIASMDVFFFNKLRDKHGMAPELIGQQATLAIVFPSAENNPVNGHKFFKEIDAIGRKTNNPRIPYSKDGIKLDASFLPISVRYRFQPE